MKLWSKQCYNQTRNKRKKLLALYVSVSVLWLVLCVCNLLFSKENYTPYLITNIVLTIFYGWFSVFFFTVSFASVNALCKLQKAMCNATEKEEILTFEEEKEDRTQNTLILKVYSFTAEKSKRELLSFTPILFEKGTTYRLCTLKNIIVSYEVQDE